MENALKLRFSANSIPYAEAVKLTGYMHAAHCCIYAKNSYLVMGKYPLEASILDDFFWMHVVIQMSSVKLVMTFEKESARGLPSPLFSVLANQDGHRIMEEKYGANDPDVVGRIMKLYDSLNMAKKIPQD